jgi:hypothetical protein
MLTDIWKGTQLRIRRSHRRRDISGVAAQLPASQNRTMLGWDGWLVSTQLWICAIIVTCTCGVPASNIDTVNPHQAASRLASSVQINTGILPQITLRPPHSTSTDVPTKLLNNPQRGFVFTSSQKAFVRKTFQTSPCFFNTLWYIVTYVWN